MQRRLVSHRSAQERRAILFQRDGEALEPVAPLRAQMTLEPDLVDDGCACVVSLLIFHAINLPARVRRR